MKRKTADVIKESRMSHDLKYDYSETIYTKAKEKFKVICPKHGAWQTTYQSHVLMGHGCQRCGTQRQAPDLEEIKELEKLDDDDNGMILNPRDAFASQVLYFGK